MSKYNWFYNLCHAVELSETGAGQRFLKSILISHLSFYCFLLPSPQSNDTIKREGTRKELMEKAGNLKETTKWMAWNFWKKLYWNGKEPRILPSEGIGQKLLNQCSHFIPSFFTILLSVSSVWKLHSFFAITSLGRNICRRSGHLFFFPKSSQIASEIYGISWELERKIGWNFWKNKHIYKSGDCRLERNVN